MDFIVLDTETTALPKEGGSIVEIAMLEVKNWEVVDRLHFMVRPTTPMTAGAALANGIKEKDLIRCPLFKDIEPEVSAWLNLGLPVIGYNSDIFDKIIIEMEYNRLGIPAPHPKWVDVYKIVCNRFTYAEVEEKTGQRSRSQVNMAKFFGVSAAGAHRALADVEILLKIFRKLHEEKKEIAPSKKPSDYEAKKEAALTALSKVKVEVVAVKAITLASTMSAKVYEKLPLLLVTVTDEDSNEKAAKSLVTISNFKKEVVKARQEALSELKSVVSSIEEMFRDWVVKPLDAANTKLSSEREIYIRKQYEKRIEEANRKRKEIEELAQAASQKVFDEVKAKSGIDDAVTKSETVYSNIAKEAELVVAEKKTETKAGSAKVHDKIVFDVEIVDAKAVPTKWLSPDIEKITAFVNETNGEIPISGVMIKVRAESKISRR